MLNRHVTRIAVADEIAESVRLSVTIYTKFPERFDVVNGKLCADLVLRLAATLASVPISMSCATTLLQPVWAIVFSVSTLPGWMIGPGEITVLSLPGIMAGNVAEIMFPNPCRGAMNGSTTKRAGRRDSFYVLRVIRALVSVNHEPFITAGFIAKSVVQSIRSTRFACHWFSARVARLGNSIHFRFVPTPHAAILLLGMVSRGQENFTAKSTRLRMVFSHGFSGASDRAEFTTSLSFFGNKCLTALLARFFGLFSHISEVARTGAVFSLSSVTFWAWLSTEFTLFHALILPHITH